MGGRKRILKLCSACNQMLVLDQPRSVLMIDEMYQQGLTAIDIAKSGATMLPAENGYPEEPIDRVMMGLIDMLIVLDGRDRAEELIKRMEDQHLSYLHEISMATYCHSNGPNGGAEGWYLRAIETADDPNFVIAMLARYYLSVGENQKAITGYEQVAAMNPTDPHPVLNLIDLYTNQKSFDKAVEQWHRVFEIHPLFKADKKLWKMYLKSCKKAGAQPVSQSPSPSNWLALPQAPESNG